MIFFFETVTHPIANKCYKCVVVVGDLLPFLCGWGEVKEMLSGSAKREKVGTFSLSFLAVTLTF